ncbi:metallophosphoesterase [Longispora albida]|uniref:metallophosphoesterase n=1 Tax=Longispora albida TaxID=203523 RepID=UPI000365B4CD|nr:metallophosphoesterase [Longispora albida]
MADLEAAPPVAAARPAALPVRRLIWLALPITVLLLLYAVPWWTLVMSGTEWPSAVATFGTVLFAAGALGTPALMILGHGRKNDAAARVGDTLVGVIWVLFTWSVLSLVLRAALAAAGVADPARSRITALAVIAITVPLLIWGYAEAMRVPRVRRTDVVIPRLGKGLDGTRIVVLADTHYGPINRVRWSRGVADLVNTLDADLLVHAGDIADGTPSMRREQSAPLAGMKARLGRVYVTGNHEYMSGAESWVDRMNELGWTPLHNEHLVVERGGDKLVVAGVDDRTARSSGINGHGADHARALAGTDPDLPVVLVAHQPKQIAQAVESGADLQISGHTHAGQIWPFNFLVRLDQPAVRGLTRHSERTQLYTSSGTGFWGPPLRIFAPSEVSVLTLRSA